MTILTLAVNTSHVYIGLIFPKPRINFILAGLILLLILTSLALLITGLGSSLSLFAISLSLGVNLLALQSELKGGGSWPVQP